MAEHVAIEMRRAALPVCARKNFRDRFDRSPAGIRNNEADAFKAAVLQVTHKSTPALNVHYLPGVDPELPLTAI